MIGQPATTATAIAAVVRVRSGIVR